MNEQPVDGSFVFVEQGEKVLLVEHAYQSGEYPAGMLSLPGGGLKPHEEPEAVVLRRAARETGLLLLVTRKIGIFRKLKSPGVVHLFEAVVRAGVLESESGDTEIISAQFLDPEATADQLYPGQSKLIAWARHHRAGKPIVRPLVDPESYRDGELDHSDQNLITHGFLEEQVRAWWHCRRDGSLDRLNLNVVGDPTVIGLHDDSSTPIMVGLGMAIEEVSGLATTWQQEDIPATERAQGENADYRMVGYTEDPPEVIAQIRVFPSRVAVVHDVS